MKIKSSILNTSKNIPNPETENIQLSIFCLLVLMPVLLAGLQSDYWLFTFALENFLNIFPSKSESDLNKLVSSYFLQG